MNQHLLYRIAAIAVFLGALLHLIAPVFGGLDSLALFLALAGIIYLGLAFLLSRHKRWAAWICFLMLLAGISIAIGFSFGGTAISGWLFTTIAVSQFVALITLFVILWRNKTATA